MAQTLDQSVGVKSEDYLEKPDVEHSVTTVPELFEIESSLDRAITREFDKHIVPWLFGLWLLAFIDRSNIGNAKIDGLVTDLDLGGNKFNIVHRTRACVIELVKCS